MLSSQGKKTSVSVVVEPLALGCHIFICLLVTRRGRHLRPRRAPRDSGPRLTLQGAEWTVLEAMGGVVAKAE